MEDLKWRSNCVVAVFQGLKDRKKGKEHLIGWCNQRTAWEQRSVLSIVLVLNPWKKRQTSYMYLFGRRTMEKQPWSHRFSRIITHFKKWAVHFCSFFKPWIRRLRTYLFCEQKWKSRCVVAIFLGLKHLKIVDERPMGWCNLVFHHVVDVLQRFKNQTNGKNSTQFSRPTKL